MTIIRVTSIACATLLVCTLIMVMYGYNQDQYVVQGNGAFVSIFDRKHRTINICDKLGCRMESPQFEAIAPKVASQVAVPQANQIITPPGMLPQQAPIQPSGYGVARPPYMLPQQQVRPVGSPTQIVPPYGGAPVAMNPQFARPQGGAFPQAVGVPQQQPLFPPQQRLMPAAGFNPQLAQQPLPQQPIAVPIAPAAAPPAVAVQPGSAPASAPAEAAAPAEEAGEEPGEEASEPAG